MMSHIIDLLIISKPEHKDRKTLKPIILYSRFCCTTLRTALLNAPSIIMFRSVQDVYMEYCKFDYQGFSLFFVCVEVFEN